MRERTDQVFEDEINVLSSKEVATLDQEYRNKRRSDKGFYRSTRKVLMAERRRTRRGLIQKLLYEAKLDRVSMRMQTARFGEFDNTGLTQVCFQKVAKVDEPISLTEVVQTFPSISRRALTRTSIGG